MFLSVSCATLVGVGGVGFVMSETERILQKVAEMQVENARQLKEQREKDERRQEEADRRQEEADRRQKEAERRQEEVDRQLKKLAKSIKALRRHVGGQDNRWSRIVESLVAGDLHNLLANILLVEVRSATRVKNTYQGRMWEIDVLAENGDVAVPVEVKTTLKKDDIDHFIARILTRFTVLIPSHKNSRVYGAIAFVKADGNEADVVNYALQKGLIVIKAMRGTNHVVNPADSELRNFNISN